MNKLLIILIIGFVIFVGALVATAPNNVSQGLYDEFAKCLADKGFTMYGAAWCPHCLNEKRALGSSFKYIPYVECPDDPDKCLADGIVYYPTWIDKNGKKYVGEQGPEKLSAESGCSLPKPI